MKKTEEGNFDVVFNSKYNDEIGELGNAFNNMVKEKTNSKLLAPFDEFIDGMENIMVSCDKEGNECETGELYDSKVNLQIINKPRYIKDCQSGFYGIIILIIMVYIIYFTWMFYKS